MDPQLQDKLLNDPAVQASVQKAGQDALNDPEVQRVIYETCRAKFPEYAGLVRDQVHTWAHDPATQARAKQLAGVAIAYASDAGNQFMKKIEQGPAGVRVLAFVGAAGSCALSVMYLINLQAVLEGHIILYTVAVYQLLFALTSVLFEFPPEWLQHTQAAIKLPIDSYQDMLIENAKFLSLNGGRGLFYIFQGTLWLAYASLQKPIDLGVGLYLLFIGFLHVLMHAGVMPQTIAAKMRNGYQTVASSAAAPPPSYVADGAGHY